jgi:cytoskeletal protein CcmA (bactofilin family)
MDAAKKPEYAHIGRSVKIKGELSGSEDLYVDGQVEGTINLLDNSLTVGPNGVLKADIHAKGIVVQGKVEGNIEAIERAELTKSAIVDGDVATARMVVEDGAYLKGKVDMQREKGVGRGASES